MTRINSCMCKILMTVMIKVFDISLVIKVNGIEIRRSLVQTPLLLSWVQLRKIAVRCN